MEGQIELDWVSANSQTPLLYLRPIFSDSNTSLLPSLQVCLGLLLLCLVKKENSVLPRSSVLKKNVKFSWWLVSKHGYCTASLCDYHPVLSEEA